MKLPFLADEILPNFSVPTNTRVSPHQQSFVYPISYYPRPMPLSIGAVVVPVGSDALTQACIVGECELEFYHYRPTSNAVLSMLKSIIGECDVNTLPSDEKPVVAYIKGFLWVLSEATAHDMGAKTHKEWVEAVRKSDHDARVATNEPARPSGSHDIIKPSSVALMTMEDQQTFIDWLQGERPLRVNIVGCTDRGNLEYAVTIAGDVEFWIDAFDTRESATEFCAKHELFIEEVSE